METIENLIPLVSTPLSSKMNNQNFTVSNKNYIVNKKQGPWGVLVCMVRSMSLAGMRFCVPLIAHLIC